MYIYKITNLIDGEIYIGKTIKSIESRFKYHCRVSNMPRNYTSYLYNAMNKYGVTNFIIEPLLECFSEDELNEREKYWIKELRTQDPDIGYNILEGGEGGSVRSKEYQPTDKLLEALEKGRHMPSSLKLRHQLSVRRKGCIVTQHTKNKLREGSLGRVHIHKGTRNLNPKREELPNYLNDGWETGYCKREKSSTTKGLRPVDIK